MVNNTYDINRAMMAIENEIMASMMRNMKRHRVEEVKENKQWSMWQAEQLKELKRWKAEAEKKYNKRFLDINSAIDTLIMEARSQGNMDQEASILRAIKKGYKPPEVPKGKLTTTGEFFKLNDRKINALIKATKDDVKKAQYATLRMADDQYRKAIFNAQMYAASGAGTYEKAVDMAVKDYLARGITCVEYKNGARHTASDYIDMAIKTASKRAYFAGEGEKRMEWGITTVRVSQRQGACPKCANFVGKVLIDDVWSGGKKTDGNYPLMSTAIARGLYHPRCLDGHSTYFPDVSTPPKPYTEEEKQDLLEAYRTEQKRQYAERQAAKYGRMAELMLDEDDRKGYGIKKKQWEEQTQTLRNNSEYQDRISRRKEECKYATENPYEAFAEGFLAKEKGQKIPESIEKVIEDAKVRAGIKNIANIGESGIIKKYEGIPKSWTTLGNKDVQLNSANPMYRYGNEYSTNCYNCVVAYEMRRRKWNVIAKPTGKNHYLMHHPEAAWIDPDVIIAQNGKSDILKAFEAWPDGARIEIAVEWKMQNNGHVFIAEKRGEKIGFYDVQVGQELTDKVFDDVKNGSVKYWRIDNLEISDRGITACREV